MLFSEIVQQLMIRSGQYITQGGLADLGLTMATLWPTFLNEIEYYETYFPETKKFNIYVNMGPNSAYVYDFTQDPHNAGYNLGNSVTVMATQNLIDTATQTFNILLNQQGIQDTSLSLLFNGVPAATDLAGNLVFGNSFSNYSGTINYLSGLIQITATNIMMPTTINITATANYTIYGNPPEYISKYMPVGFRQTMYNWFNYKQTGSFIGQQGRVPQPRQVISPYRKPMLYSTEPGRIDIEASYKRWKVYSYSNPTDPSTLLDVDIINLDRTKILMDLLYARFLTVVGNSRAAFVHTDMPITTNADELVSMGERLYPLAEAEMWAQQDWWKAIRG